MLLYKDDNWPLLWVYCDKNWNDDEELNRQMQKFSFYLDKAKTENQRFIMVFKCIKGVNPGIAIYMKFISTLMSFKDRIGESLEKTIVWHTHSLDKLIISAVLKVYNPVRPVLMAGSEDEVKELVNKHK